LAVYVIVSVMHGHTNVKCTLIIELSVWCVWNNCMCCVKRDGIFCCEKYDKTHIKKLIRCSGT